MIKTEKIDIIRQNIEASHIIKIIRSKTTDDLNVIPLAIGENLVLLQDFYDFDPDGFVIIRIKDITSVRVTKSQEFTQLILKEEGILYQLKKPSVESLNNWSHVLIELVKSPQIIIVECEKKEPPEFHIGKILEFDNKSLSLLYFNGAGEWDKVLTKILLKDITLIRFDAKYINIISKYIPPIA